MAVFNCITDMHTATATTTTTTTTTTTITLGFSKSVSLLNYLICCMFK